ncbi:hypothetical protein O6P43_016204 [Quillaja saponaria]|uniref:Uncharacterized protein n=1 Tax=Quillaja saponaria TaxID=32244 RepID=A0AAD7M127_QUISA|nr:hypothetical protein O6P43_016204 [Quillaja saponaria]
MGVIQQWATTASPRKKNYLSDSGSASSIVEDDNEENQLRTWDSNLDVSCKIVPVHDNLTGLDVSRIRVEEEISKSFK